MKKLLFTFLAALYCTVMNAQDVTFTAGGINYNVTGENTVEVGINKNLSESVVIPATVINPDDGKTYNVTGIGETAFFFSRYITSVSIPEGVTYIGLGAFQLTALTSISLPEGVTYIGIGAFQQTALTSISLPEGLISIGDEAFSYCRNIEGDLVIPSTVTSIGKEAFSHCDVLTSVTIKGGSIGESAFNNCRGLTSLSLQEGVTSIGSQAFNSCQKIKDLVIPSTVKSIGEGAFKSVLGIRVKVFALVPPELGNGAFDAYTCTCYVPDVKKYQECDGWKDYYYNIKLLTEFRLGDQMCSLDETGNYFEQDLTFNDKDTYVSGSDFTAKKLTYSRTFTNNNWQPLYVPFAISYDDWYWDFEVAAINNFHEETDDMGQTVRTELEIRMVTSGTLKPNHPYLIRAKGADKNTPQEINISSKKMYKSEENSIVCSSVERKYTFTGTYRDITGMRTKDYIFLSGGSLYRATDDNVKLSAQRWYLSIESLGSQVDGGYTSDVKAMEFDIKLLDDEATNIDEITVTRTPLKISVEAIYNLNGMRVNDSYKGIVIKNGKKVLQK